MTLRLWEVSPFKYFILSTNQNWCAILSSFLPLVNEISTNREHQCSIRLWCCPFVLLNIANCRTQNRLHLQGGDRVQKQKKCSLCSWKSYVSGREKYKYKVSKMDREIKIVMKCDLKVGVFYLAYDDLKWGFLVSSGFLWDCFEFLFPASKIRKYFSPHPLPPLIFVFDGVEASYCLYS